MLRSRLVELGKRFLDRRARRLAANEAKARKRKNWARAFGTCHNVPEGYDGRLLKPFEMRALYHKD